MKVYDYFPKRLVEYRCYRHNSMGKARFAVGWGESLKGFLFLVALALMPMHSGGFVSTQKRERLKEPLGYPALGGALQVRPWTSAVTNDMDLEITA